MTRGCVNFPVDLKYKPFCDFMEYIFVSEKDQFLVYSVPVNHLCQFLINYEKWKQGIFNREDFRKQMNI